VSWFQEAQHRHGCYGSTNTHECLCKETIVHGKKFSCSDELILIGVEVAHSEIKPITSFERAIKLSSSLLS
jgi:hypothetical protein